MAPYYVQVKNAIGLSELAARLRRAWRRKECENESTPETWSRVFVLTLLSTLAAEGGAPARSEVLRVLRFLRVKNT
jgi:hypothetical protein